MEEIVKLDLKDRKILYQLDLNPRQSSAGIGKAVRLSKDVVNYRIKKLEELGVIRWYSLISNTYRMGLLKVKLYLTLQNETKKKRGEIVDYFCSHPKTEWVAEMSGRWDMTIGYLVKDIYEFNDAMFDLIERYGENLNEKETTISLGVYHFKKDWLLHEKREKHREVYQSGKTVEVKLDGLDDELLRVMTNNAKLPLIRLAGTLKQKPQTIRYRLDQLRKKGLVTTSKVYIDLARIGRLFYKSHVYLQKTSEKRVRSLISFCESKPEITYVIRNIGPWELEIEFEIESFGKFYSLMEEIKHEFPDVVRKYDYVVITKDRQWNFYPNCYKPNSL